MKGIYLKPLAEKQMVELGDKAVRPYFSLDEEIPEYCVGRLGKMSRKCQSKKLFRLID